MNVGTVNEVRGLPQGGRTRDELIALISPTGSISEAEVLAHINKSAKEPWTHVDFVNFFQKSCQMVFKVQDGRMYLAENDSDKSRSEEEFNFLGSRAKNPEVCSKRTRSVNQRTVSEEGILRTGKSGDTSKRGNQTMKLMQGRMTCPRGDRRDSDSSDSPSSADKSSARARKVELPLSAATRAVLTSDDTDDDENQNLGRNRPGASTRPKQLPIARKSSPSFSRRAENTVKPLESDEEESEIHRLDSKEEVYRLIHPRRRFLCRSEIERSITMDPDPKNKIPPKINLDSSNGEKESNDSDDESSDDESFQQTANYQRPVPVEKKQPAIATQPAEETYDRRRDEPVLDHAKVAQVYHSMQNQNTNALEEFFAMKEELDYRESQERDHDKVLRDIMRFGELSKIDAETYLNYFIAVQGNVECLSNGQLVAGTLVLVESDEESAMLRQLQAQPKC